MKLAAIVSIEALLKLVAETDVESTHEKENDDNSDKSEVAHNLPNYERHSPDAVIK
jgi:hypothetical protein